ncbi:MAG: hypothetical protein ACLSIQ_13785, partial [Akkermansia sp.]
SKLIIVTAGIGTTIGTTIPDENSPSGLYRDRRGQHVVSRLNPDSLQYLANQTDGQYVQLSDGAALNRFVKDIAERLDVTEGKEETRRIPNDRYIIFAVRPHLPDPHPHCRNPLALLPPFFTPRHGASGRNGPALHRLAGHRSPGGHCHAGQRHGPDPHG